MKKKLLTGIIALSTCFVMTGCTAVTDFFKENEFVGKVTGFFDGIIDKITGREDDEENKSEYNVEAAKEFLKSQYVDKNTQTRTNYEVVKEFTYLGHTYTVTWSVDQPEAVSLKVRDSYVKVKVNKALTEDTTYILTATVADPDGNTAQVGFRRKVLGMETTVPDILEGAPVEGVAYKYYVFQQQLQKDLYFAGDMSGYYYKTTEDHTKATDIYVEYVTENDPSSFYIYFDGEDGKQYITVRYGLGDDSRYHTNVFLEDTASTVFTYNTEIDSVVTSVNDNETDATVFHDYYLGNFNANTTISASNISHAPTSNVGKFAGMLDRTQVEDAVKVARTYRELDFAPAYIGGETMEITENGTLFPEVKVAWEVVSGDAVTVDEELLTLGNPAELSDVTLKATITLGEETQEKEFTFKVAPKTEAGILAAAGALASGESLGNSATLTGTVTSIVTEYDSNYENVTVMMDVNGTEIEAYRMKGAGADVIAVGYEITVSGILQNYYGALEFTSGCTLDAYVEGEAPTPPSSDATSISTILADTDGGEYTAEGTIVAVSSNGFILQDSTANIFVYLAGSHTNTVGSKVTVAGTTTVYNKGMQFDQPTVTANGTGTLPTGTPTALSVENCESLIAQDAITCSYVSITGTLSVSGNYYNVVLSDTATAQGSIYYVTDAQKAILDPLDGQNITVEGYVIAISGTKYINIVMTNATSNGSTNPNPDNPPVQTNGVSIADIADANNWVDGNSGGTSNASFASRDWSVAVSGTPVGEYDLNSGKYYQSNESWRIYQNETPSIVFTANEGKQIVSISITYSVKNTGTLTLNGTAVASKQVVTVNANTVTFSVGNTGTASNGNVQITAIEVVCEAVQQAKASLTLVNGDSSDSDDVVVGSTLSLPTPTLTGKTFVAWVDGEGNAAPATMPETDLTLYAKWTVDVYTVTVTLPDQTTKTIKFGIEAVEADEVIALSALKAAVEATLPQDTDDSKYSFNVSLPTEFALQNYNFTVVANATRATLTLVNGTSSESSEVAIGSALSLPTPDAIDGKTFLGWFDSEGNAAPATMPEADLELYASWRVDVYTVTVTLPDASTKTIDFAVEASDDVIAITDLKTAIEAALPENTTELEYGFTTTIPTSFSYENYNFTVYSIAADGATLTVEQLADFDMTYYKGQKYYVEGIIDSFSGSSALTYGNVYIKTSADSTAKFLVYGIQDENGKRYDSLDVKPGIGDTIKMYGALELYNTTLEMKNGVLKAHTVCDENKILAELNAIEIPSTVNAATEINLASVGATFANVELDYYFAEETTYATITDGKLSITMPEAGTEVIVQFVARGTIGELEKTLMFVINVSSIKYVPLSVAAPVAETGYLLYLYQGNLDKTLYIDGGAEGNFLATTEDFNAAMTVYLKAVEGAEGQYYLYFKNADGATKYINASTSASSIAIGDTASTAYTYSEKYNTLLTVTGQKFIGTYNTFNTFSSSAYSYIESGNFVSHFAMLKKETEVTAADKVAQEQFDLNVSFSDVMVDATVFEVPVKGSTFEDVVIEWTADNAGVAIDNTAGTITVSLLDEAAEVTLTATFKVNGESVATIPYKFNVAQKPAEGEQPVDDGLPVEGKLYIIKAQSYDAYAQLSTSQSGYLVTIGVTAATATTFTFVKVASVTNGYYIKAGDKYVNAATSGNKLAFSTTANTVWVLDPEAKTIKQNGTDYSLQYNANSGQERISRYTSTQKPLWFEEA